MDADFLLAYDNSATANRKQKANVYRATQAEVTARSSTTKFVVPAYMPKYSSGTTSKDASDASTTQNIAHGLGVIPKYVRITAMSSGTSTTAPYLLALTTYNGTTQSSSSIYGSSSYQYATTFSIGASNSGG